MRVTAGEVRTSSQGMYFVDTFTWTSKGKRPARTYIQQLCADTGSNPENLQVAIDERQEWRERARYIRADSATWR